MATFIKDPAGWEQLTRGRDDIIARDLAKRGERLRLMAMRQAGKKTGKLAGSMRSNVSVDFRGIKVEVGSNVKHALMHHNGTRPHIIVPKRARALRFMQRGRIRYAQRVLHPGTRANRYLTDNLPKVVL